MKIIGCDFHPSYQQFAMVDTETGEASEGRLGHEQGEARRFYEALRGQPVRVGMEAMGNSQWFEQMLAEMGHELWLGDAAEIRRLVVRQQKTDKRDAQHILTLLCDGRFPRIWGTERGDARCASVAASPAEAGGDAVAGEEPAAASGVEPGRTSAQKVVESRRPRGARSSAAERMDSAASQRAAGDAGAVRPASGGEGSRGRSGSGAAAGGAAVDDASGRGAGSGTSLCAHDRTSFAISSRQAGGQLSGTDSAGEIFGRASEARLDQQTRKHHDAYAFGGSGADGIAIR
jgi:hypothetical protein